MRARGERRGRGGDLAELVELLDVGRGLAKGCGDNPDIGGRLSATRSVALARDVAQAQDLDTEFYRQFGFKDLLVLENDPAPTETSPIRMFIPIATVREAIEDAAREMLAKVPTTAPPG